MAGPSNTWDYLNGANLINPGPDEELQAGDQVLLLGTRTQLDVAKAAFLRRT